MSNTFKMLCYGINKARLKSRKMLCRWFLCVCGVVWCVCALLLLLFFSCSSSSSSSSSKDLLLLFARYFIVNKSLQQINLLITLWFTRPLFLWSLSHKGPREDTLVMAEAKCKSFIISHFISFHLDHIILPLILSYTFVVFIGLCYFSFISCKHEWILERKNDSI